MKPNAFVLVDIRKDIWPITLCTQIPLLNIKESTANPGLCGKMNIKMLHVHDQIDCIKLWLMAEEMMSILHGVCDLFAADKSTTS